MKQSYESIFVNAHVIICSNYEDNVSPNNVNLDLHLSIFSVYSLGALLYV